MTFTLSPDLDRSSDSVRRRLEMANRWLSDQPDWQEMVACGSSNRLFRARSNGRNLVLRLNATERYAFGVERRREATVLALIAGYQWAPQLLCNDWQQGWCLMDDHGDACLDSGLAVAAEPVTALLGAIEQWQRINIDCAALSSCRLDYSELLDRYRSALGPATDQVWQPLLQRFEQTYVSLAVVPECLTHHDLHPGNLCQESLDEDLSEALGVGSRGQAETCARWRVLDWEYAAIANPWFDAAALKRHLGVDNATIAKLPAFAQLSFKQFERNIGSACWLSQALECLWYMVRSSVGGDGRYHQRAKKLLLIPLPSGVGR